MTESADDHTPTPAELHLRLMKAYLAGDGAAVVEVMELIEATQRPRPTPRQAA